MGTTTEAAIKTVIKATTAGTITARAVMPVVTTAGTTTGDYYRGDYNQQGSGNYHRESRYSGGDSGDNRGSHWGQYSYHGGRPGDQWNQGGSTQSSRGHAHPYAREQGGSWELPASQAPDAQHIAWKASAFQRWDSGVQSLKPSAQQLAAQVPLLSAQEMPKLDPTSGVTRIYVPRGPAATEDDSAWAVWFGNTTGASDASSPTFRVTLQNWLAVPERERSREGVREVLRHALSAAKVEATWACAVIEMFDADRIRPLPDLLGYPGDFRTNRGPPGVFTSLFVGPRRLRLRASLWVPAMDQRGQWPRPL